MIIYMFQLYGNHFESCSKDELEDEDKNMDDTCHHLLMSIAELLKCAHIGMPQQH